MYYEKKYSSIFTDYYSQLSHKRPSSAHNKVVVCGKNQEKKRELAWLT